MIPRRVAVQLDDHFNDWLFPPGVLLLFLDETRLHLERDLHLWSRALLDGSLGRIRPLSRRRLGSGAGTGALRART